MKFNIKKLRQWLLRKTKEEDITKDVFWILDKYIKYDGLEYNHIWGVGLIVLKEWCD